MYISIYVNVFNSKKGKVADEKKVAYEKEKKYMMKIFLSLNSVYRKYKSYKNISLDLFSDKYH